MEGHRPRLFYSRRPACKTLWSDQASSHSGFVSCHGRPTGSGQCGAATCVSSIRHFKDEFLHPELLAPLHLTKQKQTLFAHGFLSGKEMQVKPQVG